MKYWKKSSSQHFNTCNGPKRGRGPSHVFKMLVTNSFYNTSFNILHIAFSPKTQKSFKSILRHVVYVMVYYFSSKNTHKILKNTKNAFSSIVCPRRAEFRAKQPIFHQKNTKKQFSLNCSRLGQSSGQTTNILMSCLRFSDKKQKRDELIKKEN